MKIPAAKIYFSDEDKEKIIENVRGVLSSGWLTLGDYTKAFENTFAEMHGVQYSIATNSGTSSLEICLRILNPDNGEVICPTNTFFATPAAVLHAGGQVKFIDIEEEFFSLDPNLLQEAISSKTKVVIIVHIGGIISPKISEIKKICRDNNIILLEDAAHAHGCHLNGEHAGSFGTAASFSFYPTKVITSGEGGMITTNDERINEKARIYRDQGKAGFHGNYHVDLGYNWRLPEINAILGLSQLGRLKEFIERRQMIAKIYDRELKSIPKVYLVSLPNTLSCNYYKYIVLLDKDVDRQNLKKKLRENHQVSL
ncbi:MAG: DegT/DnrJ/EryC1/StrS family aminotransferase, partial [Candidatus Hodarchaeota archaeon]